MKQGKKSVKVCKPLLKRSSTPGSIKKKPRIIKKGTGKNKNVNTEPLPSPDSSFSDEFAPKVRRPAPKIRNSSPVVKIKLPFYMKIEKMLWDMIQNVSNSENFNLIREEYWEIIKSSTLWELEGIFKELKTRKWVRKAIIVEICGVMISGELYHEDDYINNLKNLMLFIHQNYIEILHLLLAKIKFAETESLRKLRETVRSRRINGKSEKTINLSQNTDILSGLLCEICKHLKANSNHSALSASVSAILKNCNKMKFSMVRDAIAQALISSEPLLVKPKEPYLPAVANKDYTLVLDLDETLVHFVQTELEGTVYIRPGCEEFLKGVSEWYEVVVFTAGLKDVILY